MEYLLLSQAKTNTFLLPVDLRLWLLFLEILRVDHVRCWDNKKAEKLTN